MVCFWACPRSLEKPFSNLSQKHGLGKQNQREILTDSQYGLFPLKVYLCGIVLMS